VRYEDLPPISRAEFDAIGDDHTAEQTASSLLRLALHDPDFEFVDEACRAKFDRPSIAVRRAAVLSIGHLARRTRRVSDESRSRLNALASDASIAGEVEDALDDVATFVRP